MSLACANLITLIDDIAGTTSTTYPTAKKVIDINLALDRVWSIILQASGLWHFDDNNYDDYPTITANLVSGTRNYNFALDDAGNLLLEIYRVMVANRSGVFYDLHQIDQNRANPESLSMVDGQNVQGQPSKYNKTGKGIYLDAIPNYSYTDGIKIFIDREASYFTVLDTFYNTKKPGFAGIFHEYLALRPAYQYCYRRELKKANSLKAEMIEMEQQIEEFYSKRNKDQANRIIPKFRTSR